MQNLAEELRNGSDVAFTKVFNMWYKRLVFYANRLLRDTLEAQDVVLLVFTKLYDERCKIESNAHLKNFLYLVTKRGCLDAVRKNKKEVKIILITEERINQEDGDEWYANVAQEEENIDMEWVYTQIIEILSELPPHYKQALLERANNFHVGNKGNVQYIYATRARKIVKEKFNKRLEREY